MKIINIVLKIFFLIYVILDMAYLKPIGFIDVFLMLIILGINIYYEKYNSAMYMLYINLIAVIIGAYIISKSFVILLAMCAFDFASKRRYVGILTVFFVEAYIFITVMNINFAVFLTLICCLMGFVVNEWCRRENEFKKFFDNERRLRYELENTRKKLLNSSREVSHIAQVQERNRIAREIHDSVGHKAAGILIEIQAAYKLMEKNMDKSKEVLSKSIDALSDMVTLLKDTVYNIRPHESVGIDYIKDIIYNFSFCKVNFKAVGNFKKVPSDYMESIATNIKEALTNASKYSKASQMDICVEVNELYLRLYIKDNGVGCKKIKEGLGLSGIRERVNNFGGSISVSSDDGFLIVCILPFSRGEIVENIDSR